MKSLKKIPFYEWVFLIVLFFYPFRHVNIGIDFWDTGYNYTNFVYGLDHMDPMWFFSTYLANVVGHFFSLLPFGKTLIGLNVYTASTISFAALVAYFFLKKTLKVPSVIAFIGLFLSINLCWCPTALLYNYLTYLFLLLCTIFLYKGLSEHKSKYLFIAGLFLGANVLVRFSNAAEAALIVGVWAYAVIEAWYDEEVFSLKWKTFKAVFWKKTWSRIWRNTLWCLGGYLTSLVAFLGYIAVRYGIGTYVEAISRLFGMTEESTGYTPKAMLLSIYYNYRQGLDWGIYLIAFSLLGWILWIVLEQLKKRIRSKWFQHAVLAVQLLSLAICFVIGLIILYQNNIFGFDYHAYSSMHQLAIIFLILAMALAIIKVLAPGVPKEEKLISGLVILVNFVTSIGSNTGLFPCINNTFILMTFFLWQLSKLVKEHSFITIKNRKIILYPLWIYIILYMCFLAYQSIGFGSTFVFAEASGIQDAHFEIENNEVLSGVSMQKDRSDSFGELSDFVNAQGLKGRTTITYWGRPSLSFYLEMPPAFNAWPDLASYQVAYMQEDLREIASMIASNPSDAQNYPVVITTTFMATYEGELADTTEVAKWLLLKDYLSAYSYEVIFQNDQFTMYDVVLP